MQWWRCCCPPPMPATREIPGYMYMQLPFAFAPRPCSPRSSAARRSLLPGSFRHASCVYWCLGKLNLERCKWNHRAARVWASWPTWRAGPEGGGRPSINFSEVLRPARRAHLAGSGGSASEAALKSVYATQIASSSLVAHLEVPRRVELYRMIQSTFT